jgi:hypothetical protein
MLKKARRHFDILYVEPSLPKKHLPPTISNTSKVLILGMPLLESISFAYFGKRSKGLPYS